MGLFHTNQTRLAVVLTWRANDQVLSNIILGSSLDEKSAKIVERKREGDIHTLSANVWGVEADVFHKKKKWLRNHSRMLGVDSSKNAMVLIH